MGIRDIKRGALFALFRPFLSFEPGLYIFERVTSYDIVNLWLADHDGSGKVWPTKQMGFAHVNHFAEWFVPLSNATVEIAPEKRRGRKNV